MNIANFLLFAIIFLAFLFVINLLIDASVSFSFRHIDIYDVIKKIPNYEEVNELKKRQLLAKYLWEPYINGIIQSIKQEQKRKNQKRDRENFFFK